MAITIKDVAKKAGVAPSTVSRVIADSPSISDGTKNKVRKVMKELNYFPNANAQGLASNRSKTFGVILPMASDAFYQSPFFPTIMRGINYAMSKHDYSILISAGQSNAQRLKHIQKIVNGKQVEGLIFLYASKNDPLLDFALRDGIPTVVIGTPNNTKVHLVDNDNENIGYLATKHLIKEGCENIAYIGGDMDQYFILDRLKGVEQALKEFQLAFDEKHLYNDLAFLPIDGYNLANNTLDLNSFDGFVISDELVADGVRQALIEKELGHIRTITFKSYEQQLHNPFVKESYINLNTHELGNRAVNILFDSLEKVNTTQQRYIHEYIDGEIIHTP